MNINSVTLAGRLTRDPELKYTPSGTAVCEFSLAQNERRKDGEDRAHFFEVVAFGRTAETVAEHKRKGDLLVVEGRLQQDRWEAKDGGKRSKVGIVAHRAHFGPRAGAAQAQDQSESQEGETHDDIPF